MYGTETLSPCLGVGWWVRTLARPCPIASPIGQHWHWLGSFSNDDSTTVPELHHCVPPPGHHWSSPPPPLPSENTTKIYGQGFHTTHWHFLTTFFFFFFSFPFVPSLLSPLPFLPLRGAGSPSVKTGSRLSMMSRSHTSMLHMVPTTR